MSRWNAQDGLFHFLFANEDAYVLDSMVSLNLTDKLYYEMRRRHFEKVLFLEGLKGNYSLWLFNEPSWQFCYDHTKSYFGSSLLGKGPYQPMAGGYKVSITSEQIIRLVSSASDTAFIFSLDTFAEIFRDQAALLYELQEMNNHNKNLMILRAGVTAEDSLDLFTDPEGIFQATGTEGYLFPELVSAFLEEDYLDEGCYVRLNNYLNNRCVFLNRFSKNAVSRIVRFTALILQGGSNYYSDQELDRIGRFIWNWYHDETLQIQYPDLFSENDERKFSLLAKELNDKWYSISDIASEAELTAEPVRYIPESFVISHNLPEKQMKTIRIQNPASQSMFLKYTRRLLRSLQKPRNSKPDGFVQKTMERQIARMKIAVMNNDPDTFERAERAVYYAIGCRFRHDDENSLNWECYDKIVETSANLFEMEQTVVQYNNKIARMQIESNKLSTRIDRNTYSSEFERAAAAQRVLSLEKSEIPAQENLRAYVQHQISDIRKILQKLESGVALSKQIPLNDPEISGLLQALSDKIHEDAGDPLSFDFGKAEQKASNLLETPDRKSGIYYD